MNTVHRKAVVVSSFWATVLGGALTAGIVGGVAFAFSVSARTEVLSSQMSEIQKASLPTEMATLKQVVMNTNDTLSGQQKQLNEMSQKLDYLIKIRLEDRENPNGRPRYAGP